MFPYMPKDKIKELLGLLKSYRSVENYQLVDTMVLYVEGDLEEIDRLTLEKIQEDVEQGQREEVDY